MSNLPSSLKGVAYDWLYSLPSCSIHNLEGLTEFRTIFLLPGHHLLSVKMRHSDSLKAYIDYFQNQLVKVHNCRENASAFAFISGLQATHSLYKHLVKYVSCWSEILYRAQPYIQLEEVMKNSANSSFNRDDDEAKKPQLGDSSVNNQGRG